MKRIAIVGSCVSRDVFRICDTPDFEVSFYCMHTCVPAIMAPPTTIPEGTDFSHMSPFYQRNIKRDFRKSLFRELAEAEYDAIVIDLVEERYDLYVRGEETISDSHALEITTLKALCDDTMEWRPRGAFSLDAFDHRFAAYASRLVEVAAGRPVFLNACHFAKQYVHNGSLQIYDPTFVEAQNHRLDHYYGLISSTAGVVSIDSRNSGFRGSVEHTWGIYPYHFEDSYYQFVVDSLREHFGSVGVVNVLSHEEFRFSPDAEAYQRDAVSVRDIFISGDYERCLNVVDQIRNSRRLSADECHYYGRSLLQQTQRAAEAIPYLETALRHRASEPVWVHVSLAQALRLTGDGHSALRQLLEAARITADDNTYANGMIYDQIIQSVYSPDLTAEDRALLSSSLRDFWKRAR